MVRTSSWTARRASSTGPRTTSSWQSSTRLAPKPWLDTLGLRSTSRSHIGLPVQTLDENEHFKFGASKVYRSMFSVKAWFAIHGKQFGVRVSIVPCNVPLLFSRPVLGSFYDVAKQQVGLSSLNLQELPLLTSPTGHPALLVSDFGKNPLLEELPEFSPEAVHIPALEAYMSASQPSFKPLFFPKKLSREIQLLLESQHALSGASFVGWWKSANQSRDFWLETEDEFIRIHVVPRKHFFNPAAWNTSLESIKWPAGREVGRASNHRAHTMSWRWSFVINMRRHNISEHQHSTEHDLPMDWPQSFSQAQDCDQRHSRP